MIYIYIHIAVLISNTTGTIQTHLQLNAGITDSCQQARSIILNYVRAQQQLGPTPMDIGQVGKGRKGKGTYKSSGQGKGNYNSEDNYTEYTSSYKGKGNGKGTPYTPYYKGGQHGEREKSNTKEHENAQDLTTKEKATAKAVYTQSLALNMTTHGMPHRQVHDGTQTQKPTEIGTTIMVGGTTTHRKKTGLKDAHRSYRAVLISLGFRVHRLHQFQIQ